MGRSGGGTGAPFSVSELWAASQALLEARQAPGVDGMFPAALADPEVCQRAVQHLHAKLRDGVHRWKSAKRGRRRLLGGKVRLHAIPTVEDGILLRAITSGLRDAWGRVHPSILGGRPGVDAREALHLTLGQMEKVSRGWVLRWDIEHAYADAPLDVALSRLRAVAIRPDLVDLAAGWYRKQASRFPGLVEGGAPSPLLLAALIGPGVFEPLVRAVPGTMIWMDDGLVVVPSRAAAAEAHGIVKDGLSCLGMKLHPTKTVLAEFDTSDPRPTEWSWLGHEFSAGKPQPSRANRFDLVADVRSLVAAGKLDEAWDAVEGWARWFAHCGSADAIFAKLDLELAGAVPAGTSLPSVLGIATQQRAARGTSGNGVRVGPRRRRRRARKTKERGAPRREDTSGLIIYTGKMRPPRGKALRPRVKRTRVVGVAGPGANVKMPVGVLLAALALARHWGLEGPWLS